MRGRISAWPLLVAALSAAPGLFAQTGNIDPSERHAWAESSGWLDLRPAFGGVTVLPAYLAGYAWHEGLGWVKLGVDAGGPYGNTLATDWGVNLDLVTGALSGYAWAENAGWIRMDPGFGGVTYDRLTQRMSGWAWSESFGWIHFRSTTPTAYGVAVTCATITVTPTNDGPRCERGTVQLSVNFVDGATYSWTGPGSFTSSEMLPTLSAVTPAMAGEYTVTVSPGACAPVGGTTTVVVDPAPVLPVLTTPASLMPEQLFTASVPAVAGVSYSWNVANGTVTAGSGTRQITVTAGTVGPLTISVTETNTETGCISEEASESFPLELLATRFHPVAPCRLFDTRESTGASAAGPILAPGETRTFTVGARCGLPSTARALSVNQTVTAQTASGELVLFRGDLVAPPEVGNVSYGTGKTRANNGVLELSRSGDGTFNVHNRSTGPVHFILDVSGLFQ